MRSLHPGLELEHRALELAQHHAQHQAGKHQRADEERQQHERFGGRASRLQRVPERHGADHGDRAGDLALPEAERRPDDQRHDEEGAAAKPVLNTSWAAPRRRMANSAASTSLRALHTTVLRAAQLRISGAKASTPQASPCHHVDQLPTSSSARHAVERAERQQREGRRDRAAQRGDQDELARPGRRLEAMRHADVRAHQPPRSRAPAACCRWR